MKIIITFFLKIKKEFTLPWEWLCMVKEDCVTNVDNVSCVRLAYKV